MDLFTSHGAVWYMRVRVMNQALFMETQPA